MATVQWLSLRKWVLLYLVLFLFASVLVSAFSEPHSREFLGRRRMLAKEIEEDQPKKKTSTKNQTKLIKPFTNSTKKAVSPSISSTYKKAKLNSTSSSPNTPSNSTKLSPPVIISVKKLGNSTSKFSNSTKKSIDLSKQSPPKNKILPIATKQPQSSSEKKTLQKNQDKKVQSTEKQPKQQKPQNPIKKPNWLDEDDAEDDLLADFRDLPTKFHQTIVPDLERISTTSKVYITKANKEIIEGFRPLVGKQYASTIASITSCIFILAPLLLVSLIFNRFKSYFSLQQILIFVQAYLSIYFSILCFASLATGLEPLKFFYATSQSTYVWLQVLQTLGYVLYLLLLLMYLVLVFSTESGLGSKLLGLGQTTVGFAIGLHYYVNVFHRAVLRQPPKTNWKVHGIYATCFLLICLLARADRRKKAYMEEGGDEGKKN